MGKNTIQEEEFLWPYYKAINISLKKTISSMFKNIKFKYFIILLFYLNLYFYIQLQNTNI